MKVLITADIHIGIYDDYNFYSNARIDQFRKLSDRLVELGKEYECKECWILGDFYRVPTNKGRVMHLVKDFLENLSNNFSKIRYILGNHDLDAKSDAADELDSSVGVYGIDNFIYMDHKLLENCSKKIGFMNWSPSQNLDWVSDKLDLLCGHYTKSTLFGQEIDESKFDLMIHGDIHNDQVIGKFISVGNPIQHDYSSQPDGTVIILDTETLDWKHVKVDEDRSRFLRLYYTDNAALEGFKSELEYYKYKPPIQNSINTDSETKFEWKDINDLITKLTEKYEVLDIHQEIVSGFNLDVDIDFNFQLIELDIKGFRSIVEFHLYFNEQERIVLLGGNGSGKSSVIGALRGVFDKSRYLNWDKSELTDYLSIYVKFKYQNKIIEITKGDENSLYIDGIQQNYNNKRDFEDDLIHKYPFIQYLDLFFISAGSSNLSDQLSPDRRIDLLSKFYRLNKFSNFSQESRDKYNEKYLEINKLHEIRSEKSGALNHINQRLAELDSIDVTKLDELTLSLSKLEQLRKDYDKHRDWELELAPKRKELESLTNLKEKYKVRLDIDYNAVKFKITKLESDCRKLEELFESQSNRSKRLKELIDHQSYNNNKGSELNNKLTNLRSQICPECGNKIEDKKSAELIFKYEEELKEVQSDWDKTQSELDSYTKDEFAESYFTSLLSEIKTRIKDNSDQLLLLNNKISQYDLAKKDLSEVESKLTKVNSEIKYLSDNEPEDIKLPLNLSDQEIELRSEIAKINEKIKEEADKLKFESDIENIESEITEKSANADRYLKYSELMSNTGEVIEMILRQLAEKFSSTDIKYEVDSGVYRNKRYITFNAFYKVKSRWRVYERLSDGQKQVCDADFLNKLFSTRVGLLVLDEYLRHLDDENFSKCINTIMNMNINTILISTHDPNITNYTKRILLSLDSNGATQSIIQ